MNINTINICPTCVHRNSCVLTTQKSKVWNCSEYDQETEQLEKKLKFQNKSTKPTLVTA